MDREIVTKQDLVKAYNNDILVKISESINRCMDRLAKNPATLNSQCNQMFLSDIHPFSMTDSLYNAVMDILVTTFGFEKSDILNITLSSDSIPCLLITFKLQQI